ncbi:MAG: riboflavin synthase [Hyphomicrobiales bacterium]|nr:riboflavin synthase [Hyphomicrobiales bacterium]
MFTGIITALGEIRRAEGGRFAIAAPYPAASIAIGASIACDGCCLTATTVEADGGGAVFTVDASDETLRRTTLGEWRVGSRVNLERSLKLGDEMGGHLVAGHVDGLAQVVSVDAEGFSRRFLIEAPAELAGFIAPKGSVCLDGTSLTVNEVKGAAFTVNLIPHSLAVTTWGQKLAGDRLNLEVDLIARYVARLLAPR